MEKSDIMEKLDSMDDQVYVLVRAANRLAGYDKYDYKLNPDDLSGSMLSMLKAIKGEFAGDPATLRDINKMIFVIETIKSHNIRVANKILYDSPEKS